MTRTPRRHRGFALLIVMVIASAAVIVAVSLTRLAGSAAQVSAKEEQNLLAANAARTGVERATAYALAIAADTDGDFDLVLDPLEEANCANMDPGGTNTPFNFGQIDGTNTILRPRFNDTGAAHVQWPLGSGRWWRMVPYEGGAYLVRFEDDGDDDCSAAVAATLTNYTSNHDSNGCREGVLGTGDTPPGNNSAVNPVRDMNRAIWVISMGIYPGTNPATARHRATERRMISDASVSVGGTAFVADEIHGHGDSFVTLESDECQPETGEMHVSGSDTTWRICQAGSNNWNSSGSTAAAANCGSFAYAEVNLPSAPAVPSIPAWNHWSWMNPASRCNFFVRSYGPGNTNPEGLWWWNTNGQFSGGQRCDTLADLGASIPAPATGNGPGNANTRQSCWVPIMVSPGPGDQFDICEFGQMSTSGANLTPPAASPGPYGSVSAGTGSADPAFWYPTNTAPTAVDDTCNGYFNGPLESGPPQLPDFLTECGGGVTLPGRGLLGACTGCQGAPGTWALRYSVGGPPFNEQWRFASSGAGNHNIPNGFYIFDGGNNFNNVSNWNGTEPPMITVMFKDKVDIRGSSNMAFGSGGQPYGGVPTAIMPAFPGVIIPGSSDELDVYNDARFTVWGGFYMNANGNDANINDDSLLTLTGPVVIEGKIQADDDARFTWRYPDSFFAVSSTPAATDMRLSFPIRF